jgi:hypothetical protein
MPARPLGLTRVLSLSLWASLLLALSYLFLHRHPPTLTEVARMELLDIVAAMHWRAAMGVVVLSSLLLATQRWWAVADAQDATLDKASPWTKPQRWLFIGILLLAAALRVPRLGQSLYNDEAHNTVRLFVGGWRTDQEAKLRVPKWHQTLWLNAAGNNSQPFSLLARSSYELWLKLTGQPRGQVSETALRLPSLLLGLGSMGLLGALARRRGGTTLMIGVMLAAALHGWHLRYSTEARGYCGLLLGASLIAYSLESALRSGRWRSWLLFSLGTFLCAWFFTGSIFFLFSLYCLVMGYQLWRYKEQRIPLPQVLRPLVAGALAVMVALPLLLPSLPQVTAMLESLASIRGEMGSDWWQNAVAYVAWGCCWIDPDPHNPVALSLARHLTSGWGLPAALLSLVSLLYGAWQMCRHHASHCVFLLASILSVPLAWGAMTAKGNYLHLWYLIAVLPAILLCLGHAAAGLARWSRWLVAAPILPLLLTSLPLTHLAKQSERDALELALGDRWPASDDQASVAVIWSIASIYHPKVAVITDSQHFDQFVQQAKLKPKPVFVILSHKGQAQGTHADAVKRLDSPEFELVRTFWGQEEAHFTSYLYRLRSTP